MFDDEYGSCFTIDADTNVLPIVPRAVIASESKSVDGSPGCSPVVQVVVVSHNYWL